MNGFGNYENNRKKEKFNRDNKNEKVESYDEFDIHDGIDNNLAKNETHQKTEQNSKNRKHLVNDIIKNDNISKDVKKGIVGFYATDTNGLFRNLGNIGVMF